MMDLLFGFLGGDEGAMGAVFVLLIPFFIIGSGISWLRDKVSK